MSQSDRNIKLNIEDFELNVPESAFNMDANRSSLSTVPARYNKQIKELNSAVEELDRHDDFSALKISADKYKRGGGAYGIEFDPAVHKGGSVIQPHQRKAAKDFLKRLRGFGMLADVVGSGKTFEACVVLSELAVRGVVKSMLIIAPAQVYDAWKDTLEIFFGLGKGALTEAESLTDKRIEYTYDAKGRRSPVRPLLVKWDNFIKWDESDVAGVLFDVIVVDEAHHLCDQTGSDANAMKLLSLMMQCKKEANKEYCLLLSATPHDGNLENMFPLWYFIDSKGGLPSDFGRNMADSARSAQYRNSKQRYINYICHNATTVMEFINRVKKEEVDKRYLTEFEKFVFANFDDGGDRATKLSRFYALSNGEKYEYVQRFLDEDGNEEIKKSVNKNVALAYHEGILRQIMIRQPNTFQNKKKIIKNYYFYPVANPSGSVALNVFEKDITVDCAELDTDKAITTADGTKCSVAAFITACTKNRYGGGYSIYQGQYEFISALIRKFGGCADTCGYRRGAERYYLEQFFELTSFSGRYDIEDFVTPVALTESSFNRKFCKAVEILKKHAGQRILVFFDYDKDRDRRLKGGYGYSYAENDVDFCLADKFLDEIKKIPEFADRILDADAIVDFTGDALEKKFAAKDDAILVVTSAALTEGANLQSCNVILNFQITPDPLSMDQRIGRVFRIKQENDVTIYSLADMNLLEGYVLAYFTRIGLMTSNSGDATIISGSNNEHMVTVRCKNCKKVRLFTLEDYNHFKLTDARELKCTDTDACRNEAGGFTLMREMNVHDFQCSTCKTTFSRSLATEGYKCIYDAGSSMCSTGREDDRDVYCRKICAMSHCPKFDEGGELAACPALAAYRENGNIGDQDLMEKCAGCPLKAKCPQKCRVGQFVESVAQCVNCSERKRARLTLCRPHVLKFNEQWEAVCPRCEAERREGKIRPILARTFAAFIKGLWSYSHRKDDDNFCEILSNESAKVAEIQDILAMDKSEEEV
ncbi:MAG: DEAD/DEAH box helicase family protein [Clostridia bacterium]|nr:DEAD/DEAH box helicase family protein [Clostridia bacterium]